jgi:uncharacterized protein (DUF488 family)
MALKTVATIGGYGFTEESFIAALERAKVGAFLDLRQRRGMRGPEHAFLNSRRLQASLRAAGIRYVHATQLAPTTRIRALQKAADDAAHVTAHGRERLASEFVTAYRRDILARIDPAQLDDAIGDATVIALFCVERLPEQCHRSLAADRIARDRGATVKHLIAGAAARPRAPSRSRPRSRRSRSGR